MAKIESSILSKKAAAREALRQEAAAAAAFDAVDAELHHEDKVDEEAGAGEKSSEPAVTTDQAPDEHLSEKSTHKIEHDALATKATFDSIAIDLGPT